MFIDTARIYLKAGDGGNGVVSFHREKYVAAGGPDGGDGGRGGDIIFYVDDHLSTLMDFRYKHKYTAQNGADGGGKRCTGKDGEPLKIRLPRGTLIRDTETGEIIKDMSDDEPFVAAHGGKGGWGNQHFATPTRQAPRFAKRGLPGEARDITLELKLIADAGIIGFPNVGKSTLLSVVTAANPKIANYHFTTLYPNLGVVQAGDFMQFILADIPGIIEGAADGAGLGHDFLRHVDRCRLLIHVIDVSGSEGRDPVNDFMAINSELSQYSKTLASRFQIIAANKCDILEDREPLIRLKEHAAALGYPVFEISAATHTGTSELIKKVAEELGKLPPVIVYEPEYVKREPEIGTVSELVIEKTDDDIYSVEGKWLSRLVGNINFSDYESRMYFDRALLKAGVFKMLEDAGIKEGDTVSIYNLEFEYKK